MSTSNIKTVKIKVGNKTITVPENLAKETIMKSLVKKTIGSATIRLFVYTIIMIILLIGLYMFIHIFI